MKPNQILYWIIPVFILFACNSKKDSYSTLDISKKAELNEPPQQTPAEERQKIPTGKQGTSINKDSAAVQVPGKKQASIDWDKKIIKTATLKLEVNDFKKSNEAIHQAIKQFGGYIAQEEQNTSDYKLESTVTLKVPVHLFEELMNGLSATDAKVIERKITSEDVTGEVVDVRSRLEAKKEMRLRYLDFLKQSKNMEEALQVQSEINGIQEEIEAAAGRVEYLNHQSAYSTIQLTFYQPLDGFNPVNESPSFFTRTTNAFKTGAKWFADVFVGLISIWPLILTICTVAFLFKRKYASKPKTA
ncbi:MAG: DUF4349 domain-containing protein [Ferruginibacter sp.]